MFAFAIMTPMTFGTVMTEVMCGSIGNENNLEFVEIPDAPDLSGWRIADSESNDTLLPLQLIESSAYALIEEEGFAYEGLPCSVGATIGKNVNTGGDRVTLLTPDNAVVASVTFNTTIRQYR